MVEKQRSIMLTKLLLIVSIAMFGHGCGESKLKGDDPTGTGNEEFLDDYEDDHGNHDIHGLFEKKRDLLSIIGDFFKSIKESIFNNLKLVKTRIKNLFDDEGYGLTDYESDDSIRVEGTLSVTSGDPDLGCLQVSYNELTSNPHNKHVFLIVGSDGVYIDNRTKKPVRLLVYLSGQWREVPQNGQGIGIVDFDPGSTELYNEELCFKLDHSPDSYYQPSGELIFQVAEEQS